MAAFTGYDKDQMTMRRDVLKVTTICAMLLLPVANASAQGGSPCTNGNKVALVNAQRILASIPAYVQAESLWAKEVDGYKAELAKQKGAFDSSSAAFSDKATLLTASQKTAETKKLQDQYDNLQKRIADLDAKANQRQQELLQPIQTRVQEMLDGMRAELNCSIVFDVSPGSQAGIASVDKALDLTDRVIERLKAADPSVGKPPAKPPTGTGIKPPAGRGGGGGGGELPAGTLPTAP